MRYCFFLIKLLIAGIICILVTENVQAQRYPFYNLSIEQGLIQSQATSLAQDKLGHLWIGTLGGLSRYDGRSFTSYSVRDGLPSNNVNTLRYDRNGILWVGTDHGLATYDGRSFRQYVFQSPENPQGNVILSIQPTTDNGTYCIAGGKLYAVRNQKVQSVPYPSPDKNVSAICTSGDALYMTLARTDSIYLLRNKTWTSSSLPVTAAPYIVTGIFENSHQLWLATTEGLLRQNDGIWSWYRPLNADAAILRGVSSMAAARDGSYWLGTRNGVVRINDTTFRRYQKKNGLTDNSIFALLDDAEGNLWIATDGQGLYRFSGAPFTSLDERIGLPSAQVMGLAADSPGGLYLGTYDAGLFRYAQERITPIPFPKKYVPNIVTMARDYKDDLWIGTRGEGLWRYRNSSFRQYTAKDYKVPGNAVSALKADIENQRLWVGFSNSAAVYEQDTFRRLDYRGTILDFLLLGKQSALMATSDGLRMYRDELITPFITGTAADYATPQCLAIQGSRIWIGTSDNGAIGYDTITHTSIVVNKKNGLRSDFIYSLYAAKDGTVWAGTGYGIYSIRMGNDLPPAINFYGRGQGVTGIENNHNAVLGMQDGSIWFGTTNGAMHYRPGIVKTTARPVSIVLQSVKLFGEPITDSSFYEGVSPYYGVPQQLELPYRYNNLTFTFQAIALSDEAGISYRYRMNGLESKWSEWAATNTVTYSSLPPGNYTLEVQCAAHDNRAAVTTLHYPFIIATPFHKTGLFRLLVLVGCILLGVSLQYIANLRKSARLRMMDAMRREEQNKVRERTAEDFHDEVGNKLTRINVLTNVLKSKLGTITPDAERIIGQIQDNTGQLYSGTRDILWSLKPSNDNLYEILHRIRDFGQDLFGDTEIDFRFSGTDEQWQQYRLPLDVSRNLIMIFKEAMNNCLKYAAPKVVILTAQLDHDLMLHLLLSDDGKGFNPETVKRGNGLANMQTRTHRLNGTLTIDTAPGKGTTLLLQFKIPQNRG